MHEILENLSDAKLEVAMGILEGLNNEQVEVVLTPKGIVQVDATAGSGKTHSVVRRVAFMVKVLGIKPGNIVMTTFTKKATEEMTKRLRKHLTDVQVKAMRVGTTHSIGFGILRKWCGDVNHPMTAAMEKDVLMKNKQTRFLEDTHKSLMNDRTIPFEVKEHLRDVGLKQFQKAIGLSKNDDIDHLQYEQMHQGKGPRMQAYIEFYKRYEERKATDVSIDGDDMLFLANRLLREHPHILAYYHKHWQYFIVDEAQDNSKIQNDFVELLMRKSRNLCRVGDIDQAMYSFRGADPEEFLNMRRKYPDAKLITLPINYRSDSEILGYANTLIHHNTNRLPKVIKPHRGTTDEAAVVYTVFPNEGEEGRYVAGEIKSQMDTEPYDYKDFAVLYRTNAQSQAIEHYLITGAIPYEMHGGVTFYQRREIRDLTAYLELAYNPNNDEAFERVFNTPNRYLGKACLEKVKSCASSAEASYWQAIHDTKNYWKDYEQRGIKEFTTIVNTLHDMLGQCASPSSLIDYLLGDGGYEAYLKDDTGEEDGADNSRLENINILKYVIESYDNLDEFLVYMEFMLGKTEQAKNRGSRNAVQMMSIHKAKGLEFPVVFAVGVNDGTLPHFRAIETAEEKNSPIPIEEERRLMYVDITRAEHRVYISAVRGSFYGRPSQPSRFVYEMGLIEGGEHALAIMEREREEAKKAREMYNCHQEPLDSMSDEEIGDLFDDVMRKQTQELKQDM